MQPGQPSLTARSAAAHRAAHQTLEGGRIFADPLAIAILGADAEPGESARDPARRAMRLFIAVRTRIAEEAVARAVARGVGQLVVLGAGLDTFGYRNPHCGLRVFEVDHPATQAWKRERLQEGGITVPDSLTYAPVDFERGTLRNGLAAAGFDWARPAFFSWLGVVPYLTEAAILETLRAIAGGAPGTEVVFDYGDPPEARSDEGRAAFAARAARVAALGEPWLTFFEPVAVAAKLRDLGFATIRDLGPPEIASRFWPDSAAPKRATGGHVILAQKT